MRSKLPETQNSIFSIMSKMAHKYQAINLSQGFPDFESDPQLIDLVYHNMKLGYNQYAPMEGVYGLRKVISETIEKLHHKIYNPDTEITITAGATQAIFCAISALVHPMDEVIVFSPAYDCYLPAITLAGGVPKLIQLRPPNYSPDWAEVRKMISNRTKLIIINSPHNPTGMLWNKQDMLQLQELCEQYGLYVLSDEVYEHIVFDGLEHQSAARFESLSQRTFITASFGKTFHNTGWKLGYIVGPEELMTEFRKVHQFNVFCVNHPIQRAIETYMKEPNSYLSLSNFYQNKRDFFLQKISESKFKINPANGTYFQLLDFSDISSESDVDFAERLTREYKIATIPTSVFNLDQEDFHQVRVCFAKSDETLIKASKILNSI